VIAQFGVGRARHGRVADEKGERALDPLVVWFADHRGLAHAGVRHQRVLEVKGSDVAFGIEDLLAQTIAAVKCALAWCRLDSAMQNNRR
jgi:hypothetical protein